MKILSGLNVVAGVDVNSLFKYFEDYFGVPVDLEMKGRLLMLDLYSSDESAGDVDVSDKEMVKAGKYVSDNYNKDMKESVNIVYEKSDKGSFIFNIS